MTRMTITRDGEAKGWVDFDPYDYEYEGENRTVSDILDSAELATTVETAPPEEEGGLAREEHVPMPAPSLQTMLLKEFRDTDHELEGELLDFEPDSDGESPMPDGDDGPERTLLDDTELTEAEMEAMCLETDSITRRSDDSGVYFVDLETKRRVYIDSPTDAPEGAKVQTGDGGGTYYDTDDVEAFEEAMAAVNERVRETSDFSEERWAEAEALADEYEERKDELFASIVEAAGLPDDTKAAHRVKSPASMLEKAFDRDDAGAEGLDELEDVFGAKFVPGDVGEVRDVSEALQENLEEELDVAEVEVDDRLDPDDDTYYRAVHVDFKTEDGLAGEVQVKSEEMERIIDVGHDTVYKNNAGLEEGVVEEVDDCLTAQMDALFGEDADPDDACTEDARAAIREVAG